MDMGRNRNAIYRREKRLNIEDKSQLFINPPFGKATGYAFMTEEKRSAVLGLHPAPWAFECKARIVMQAVA